MIAYYLFVMYDICGRVSVSKLGWGGYCYYVHILDITRLLHMIYVLWLVLHGNSGRVVTAIWLYTLCDRYSITYVLPAFL